MWVERPRLTHTTSQNHCAQSGSRHHWHLAVYQGPTSRRCGHARRRSTSTPRGQAHTTHTQPGSSCCVPFGNPHVQEGNAIERNQAGMQPQQRKHIGTSPPYGEDTPDRRQVKRKETKGYISKGFCANTDLCPLASPRVALVGVCLLRRPDNGNTR